MKNIKVYPKLRAPEKGVYLRDGLFKCAFDNNQSYLMKHFTIDDLLYPFRVRSEQTGTVRSRPLVPFWETDLEGSNAGRFLLGAGNTLRFTENHMLAERMNTLVEGIMKCCEPDGYCMGFKKEDMMILERVNYTRSWLTRGLIAAGEAGNPAAYDLARKFGDWFNSYRSSGKAAELHLAYQGLIAHTSLCMSEVGVIKDAEVGWKLYADDIWLEQLIAGDTRSIWQHPNDGAHGYELNAIIAYLSMYLISGEQKFLNAVLSSYVMFQKYWIHIGGSVAICEEHDGIFPYPPGSRHINADRHTGETCNNVWWLLLNRMLHHLFPQEEKYVLAMEETLYNAILPAQDMDRGIRYHAFLHGVKDSSYAENTCCEGTGTMIYGMLPELIYSLDDHGIYVDLYAGSEISWDQNGIGCRLITDTAFPENSEVRLKVLCDMPIHFSLRIRIPSWASEPVCIKSGGKEAYHGNPGTYLVIERDWLGGEEFVFSLPRKIKANRYFGFSTIRGFERYAFTFGPILMAVTGVRREVPLEDVAWNDKWTTDKRSRWNNVHWELSTLPQDGEYYKAIETGHLLKPYYEILPNEEYTCFPLYSHPNSIGAVAPNQLFTSGSRMEIQLSTRVSLLLAGIPSGSFRMGQGNYEKCERPVHTVTISKPFYLGVYPVTQEQYKCIMGINPSSHIGDGLPVEQVSYFDAEAFIKRLNLMYQKPGLKFRLPTEAEWEYAARAGTTDIVGYATDILRDFSQYAWTFQQLGAQDIQTASVPLSRSVGAKHQNMWGLYDMLGNIGEWCSDFYAPYPKEGTPEVNTNGGAHGLLKAIRGGSFTDLATYCRCATRNALEPEYRNRYTGFRVAAEIIG